MEETKPIDWTDLRQVHDRLQEASGDDQKIVDIYNQWAHNGYDETLKEKKSVKVTKAAMADLFPPGARDNLVLLEVGAGTGLTGEALQNIGFRVMDGLDPAREMLRVAEAKGIYRNLYCCGITAEPLDIPADSYDVVFMAGVIGFASMKTEAFEEMVRLVKPGGYIVNIMGAYHLEENPEVKQNWGPLMERLVKEGKWEVVKMERYPNHFVGRDGMLMVFRVL